MYGNGFFYIPGTETCLKINGRVRVEYEYEDDNETGDSTGDFVGSARVAFDARNETDFGTLRSFLRLSSGSVLTRDGSGRSVGIDEAYISLAGLTFGVQESFWARNNGYGHPLVFGGQYGFQNVVMAEYTYAANGFSATIGLQGDETVDDTELNYYAGVSYRSSAFYLAAHVQYDSDTSDTAYGVSAELNVIDNLTVQGWYHGDDGETALIPGNSDQQWGVSARYDFADFSGFYVGAGYNEVDGGSGATSGDQERITAEFGFTPVSQLSVNFAWENVETDLGTDTDSFRLRVTRTF
jgi:hypothetical protein